MASIISAGTTSGTALNMAGDTSGVLQLATNGSTTAITIDTSQRAAFVAGTAAAPAITTTGDTNTGMFFPAADTIAFAEGGTEAMRLDSSGNVKIGTTATTYDYQTKNLVLADASTAGISITNTTQTLTLTANSAGGYVGTRSNHSLQFTTNDIERMRIGSDGTVLIGSTTPPANNGYFNVNGGDIACTGGYRTKVGNSASLGGNRFNINWTGSAAQLWIDSSNLGTFAFTSDYRIKKNIETNTTPALNRIAQIRPVTYEFADYQELFKADGVAREGFIAHELAEVIPSAVEGEKDAEDQIQSLKLDALCSVMVKAIQEQQTIINDLKARITALEGAA
jgi:hypothetical protein